MNVCWCYYYARAEETNTERGVLELQLPPACRVADAVEAARRNAKSHLCEVPRRGLPLYLTWTMLFRLAESSTGKPTISNHFPSHMSFI